jgi:hypothetical protein
VTYFGRGDFLMMEKTAKQLALESAMTDFLEEENRNNDCGARDWGAFIANVIAMIKTLLAMFSA